MMLRSYAFQNNFDENLEKLFIDAGEHPECLEYSMEIIEAYHEGKIDMTRKFNIVAYANAIKRKEMLVAYRRAQQVLSIQNEHDDESGVDKFAFSENMLPAKQVNEYDKLDLIDEIKYAKTVIYNAMLDIEIAEDLNIIKTLEMAIKGIPVAIANLKVVCEKYTKVGEAVRIILDSGYSFEEVFKREVG